MGLVNHGQTCFLNSILQALSAVPLFTGYLQSLLNWYLDLEAYRWSRSTSRTRDDTDHINTIADDSSSLFSQLVLKTCALLNFSFHHNKSTYTDNQQPNPITLQERKKQLSYCTRQILHTIAAQHPQFASASSSSIAAMTSTKHWFIRTYLQGRLSYSDQQQQQDALELYQVLMDGIHKETLQTAVRVCQDKDDSTKSYYDSIWNQKTQYHTSYHHYHTNRRAKLHIVYNPFLDMGNKNKEQSGTGEHDNEDETKLHYLITFRHVLEMMQQEQQRQQIENNNNKETKNHITWSLSQASSSFILKDTSVSASSILNPYPQDKQDSDNRNRDIQVLRDEEKKWEDHTIGTSGTSTISTTSPPQPTMTTPTSTTSTIIPTSTIPSLMVENNKNIYDSSISEHSSFFYNHLSLVKHYIHNKPKLWSSTCPTPMTGWMGSSMQCLGCHHTRPIQNNLFVDISIVPTAIHPRILETTYFSSTNPSSLSSLSSSASSSPCLLETCLSEFSCPEMIQGIDCLNCSIQKELTQIQRNLTLLNDTLEYTTRKRKDDFTHLALQHECETLHQRQRFLQNLDPDTYYSQSDTNVEDGMMKSILLDFDILDHDHIPKPLRSTFVRRLFITRLPSILCIHIKRLYYDSQYKLNKCSQRILFTDTLDFKDTDLGIHLSNGSHLHTTYKLMSVRAHCLYD